jgi:hypothetical protein
VKYRIEQIVKVRETLSALPEVTIENKERITSLEAITLLSDVLCSLEKKGYTTQMLAKVLNDQGVDMSVSTLRRYLKRSSTVGAGQRRQKSTAPTVAKKRPAGKPAPAVVTVPSTGKEVEAPCRVQKSSGFGVRSDTDDI